MADVLSRIIYKGVEGNIIDSFRIGRYEVALSYLQYADDTTSFCFGKESFLILNHMMAFLEDMSRLKINRSNYFFELTVIKLQRWAKVFDYKVGSFPSSYLGLTLGGNLRALTFWDLIYEKNHKRLAMWKKGFFRDW